MRQKLFLYALVSVILPISAQNVNLQGVVVDAATGAPLRGATVSLRSANAGAASGASGEFMVPGAAGTDYVIISCNGYETVGMDITLPQVGQFSLGEIRMMPANQQAADFYGDLSDITFDELTLDDDAESGQNIAALTGANDNLYYSTASYNFGPMYFRFRGYDSQYQSVYINGIKMNDLIRGRFNFSTLLGMTSRAFRNKTTAIGIDEAVYGFGDLGGAVNYNTITETYAPGFNGSVAYTNSNYMLRGMIQYATGMTQSGWAVTVGAIGRYANEGVIEGTFYNSAGLFLSAEKRINQYNSLTLTAFGGPTQRASASATYQEAYDLMDNNLYNPNWGYFQGEKRASRIVETFDPTLMLNWLYKKDKTTINTAVTARWANYSSSAFNWYKANDPNPAYYRNLPSYYSDPSMAEYITNLWKHDTSVSQIDWDKLYYINSLNNVYNEGKADADKMGSTYILENRHSNEFVAAFASNLNQRLNSYMTLQAGINYNYTNASYYKTIRDLMGGEFWVDIDPFSDREITLDPNLLQNDLDNPNRRVVKGDRFGYDYNFHAMRGGLWLQNSVTLPHLDFYYAVTLDYTQYQRDGHMRNGRSPLNSLGKGKVHRFDDAMVKAGMTYKFNGRNYLQAHAIYGTQAPTMENIYISPRVKDDAINDPTSMRVFSGDVSYIWNYRNFRGSLTGFYTQMNDATERSSFYDDNYACFTNFVLQGVRRDYTGAELGMAYKITPSLTATFAGTYARYQYKNNPMGTRSFENGMEEDVTKKVYLKNFYLGSVPQTVCNLGIDWAAPKSWFFNINGTWQGDAYVNLSPVYHEEIPGLASAFPALDEAELMDKVKELATQDKLKNAFSLNASVGKLLYIGRKVSMNFNVSANNILNNRDVVTYAYQQSRMDTKEYNRAKYANRLTYAQGFRVFVNVGIRF